MQAGKFDYNVFKAVNNSRKNAQGCPTSRITHVNLKEGYCTIEVPTMRGLVNNRYLLDDLMKVYMRGEAMLPYIVNPSAIKQWKGFYSFTFEDAKSTLTDEIAEDIIGLIKEQYNDILKVFHAKDLQYSLVYKDKKVVFSGQMCADIPFKTKVFEVKGKEPEALKNEIKAWLFDTLDGLVNVC